MTCYICGKPATTRVTVVYSTQGKPPTNYNACDAHEPRHIPGGDVAYIDSKPVR